MKKIHELIHVTTISCILFLGGQSITNAQSTLVEAPPEPSTRADTPRAPSVRGRILLNIARAVLEVLCAEYGDCPKSSYPNTETTTPSSSDKRRSLSPENSKYSIPDFAGPHSSTPALAKWDFSFDTPAGWQSFEKQSSITVAQPSEYINGNLVNGVILGMFDLNNADFDTATETYIRQQMSINKYLGRVGLPESTTYNNVPCVINRMEGHSPITRNVEQVVVYTCKRSPLKVFYVVTVNSGPNAKLYEEVNNRITQSISFLN